MGEVQEPMKNVGALVDDLFEIRSEKERIEQQVKDLSKKATALELEIMERLEAEGATRMTGASGNTVYLREPSVYASINKEREDEALSMIREWGEGELIKPTIPAVTLSRIVKERIKEGKEVDTDLVGYYMKKKLGVRRNS